MFELPQFPKGFNSEVDDFLNSAKAVNRKIQFKFFLNTFDKMSNYSTDFFLS